MLALAGTALQSGVRVLVLAIAVIDDLLAARAEQAPQASPAPLLARVAVLVFALARPASAWPPPPATALDDRIALGVFAGLLVGKVIGISMLGAIGHTVSLLLSRPAFSDARAEERSTAAVLVASVLASLVAVILLRRRPHHE